MNENHSYEEDGGNNDDNDSDDDDDDKNVTVDLRHDGAGGVRVAVCHGFSFGGEISGAQCVSYIDSVPTCDHVSAAFYGRQENSGKYQDAFYVPGYSVDELNTSPNVPGDSVDVPNIRRAEHVAHMPGDSEGVPKTLSDVPEGSEDAPNISSAKKDH
ncbi:unnamed protein product [Heligmosomoides polygyrus]|uniref:Lipase_3 domain-containing protein n=1 Tax=Heligmosomoides polygyrus TaxID=6339 RepID=A0A183GB22_HELPZ|nr:unnamed protein product [Heligmosomoides polygyrus]